LLGHGHDLFVMDWARARRNAQRRLAELRRKLAAAERELSGAQAALRLAEHRFDLAEADVAETEQALEAARAEREQARRQRYAARQARDRVSNTVERIQRHLRELSERLDRMPRLMALSFQSHGLLQVAMRPGVATLTSRNTPQDAAGPLGAPLSLAALAKGIASHPLGSCPVDRLTAQRSHCLTRVLPSVQARSAAMAAARGGEHDEHCTRAD
jgi:multidrug efflux pump subunit AcrA (membrane-fusion protein)